MSWSAGRERQRERAWPDSKTLATINVNVAADTTNKHKSFTQNRKRTKLEKEHNRTTQIHIYMYWRNGAKHRSSHFERDCLDVCAAAVHAQVHMSIRLLIRCTRMDAVIGDKNQSNVAVSSSQHERWFFFFFLCRHLKRKRSNKWHTYTYMLLACPILRIKFKVMMAESNHQHIIDRVDWMRASESIDRFLN